MNLLKDLIERNKGILKEMDEHPDPNRMRSTRMGFEIELDGYTEVLEAWQEGKPILPQFPSSTLARALGSLNVIYQDLFIFLPDLSGVPRYTQAVRDMGMPDYTCDVFTLPNAAAIMGELPPTSLGVSDNSGICRVWSYHNKVLAQHFNSSKLGNVPMFEIDTPQDCTEESMKYLAAQLGELVKFAEENVPGLKYDEDRHKELIENNRKWINYTIQDFEFKKHIPMPMNNMESMVHPLHFEPNLYSTPPKVLKFWQTRMEELGERVAKGYKKEEELRFLWIWPPPPHLDVFGIMERLKISFVMWGTPIGVFNGSFPNWGDEEQFGRKLTPLEEEARFALGELIRAKKWAEEVVWMCRELSCDAIVYYQLSGCLHVGSLSRLIADTAERELGIPTMILKGRTLDPSDMPPAEFESRMTEFADMVLARKG
jgi:hypothetical protein